MGKTGAAARLRDGCEAEFRTWFPRHARALWKTWKTR